MWIFANEVNALQTSEQTSTCCKVAKSAKSKRRQYAWLPAMVVAILPKCPFCIMAYSGAISMCSGNNLYPHAGSYMSYVTLLLALVVLIGIAFNFKDNRTWTALAIAIIGITLVYLSQFIFISAIYYYLGVSLLFFGIWYNGSFFYFYRRYLKNWFPGGA